MDLLRGLCMVLCWCCFFILFCCVVLDFVMYRVLYYELCVMFCVLLDFFCCYYIVFVFDFMLVCIVVDFGFECGIFGGLVVFL